ncbi:hypothetical protein U1Q18_027976 [Sarracenia purpurea var. burkii]
MAVSPPMACLDKNFENISESIELAAKGANESYGSSEEDNEDSDERESEDAESSEETNVDEVAEGALRSAVVPNSEVKKQTAPVWAIKLRGGINYIKRTKKILRVRSLLK